jgi:serine/threonine protein kinase
MAAAAARKTRVSPYELGKTIGEGTFAKVKLARDSRTGTFAICISYLYYTSVLMFKSTLDVSE